MIEFKMFSPHAEIRGHFGPAGPRPVGMGPFLDCTQRAPAASAGASQRQSYKYAYTECPLGCNGLLS